MKSTLFFGGLIVTVILAVFVYRSDFLDRTSDEVAQPESHNDTSDDMHPSWDRDGDGLNDCEKDHSCDDAINYTEPQQDVGANNDPLRTQLLNGAQVLIPDTQTTVTILQEVTTYGNEEDSNTEPFGTIVLGERVLPYPNGGDQSAIRDLVSSLTINTGGSGDFVYMAYFVTDGDRMRTSDAFLLGDRVRITDLQIIGEEIVVTYNEHDAGQAMFDVPAKQVTKYFVVHDGKFAQVFK